MTNVISFGEKFSEKWTRLFLLKGKKPYKNHSHYIEISCRVARNEILGIWSEAK